MRAHHEAVSDSILHQVIPAKSAGDQAAEAKIVVELLLAHQADVNVKDNTGKTPLHVAAAGSEYGFQEIVELLLANGADINVKNNDGKTPLDAAIQVGWKVPNRVYLSTPENAAIINLLRQHGGNGSSQSTQNSGQPTPPSSGVPNILCNRLQII